MTLSDLYVSIHYSTLDASGTDAEAALAYIKKILGGKFNITCTEKLGSAYSLYIKPAGSPKKVLFELCDMLEWYIIRCTGNSIKQVVDILGAIDFAGGGHPVNTGVADAFQ